MSKKSFLSSDSVEAYSILIVILVCVFFITDCSKSKNKHKYQKYAYEATLDSTINVNCPTPIYWDTECKVEYSDTVVFGYFKKIDLKTFSQSCAHQTLYPVVVSATTNMANVRRKKYEMYISKEVLTRYSDLFHKTKNKCCLSIHIHLEYLPKIKYDTTLHIYTHIGMDNSPSYIIDKLTFN